MTLYQWIELVSGVLATIGTALAAHAHHRINVMGRRK